MKFDWRPALLFFFLAAILQLVFRGSNISWLVSLEPLSIVYLASLSRSSSWHLDFYFIFFSLLCDLASLQPVGTSAAAFFCAYLLVKLLNKAINLVSEAKITFDLIVLLLALLLRAALTLLFSNNGLSLSVIAILLNCILLIGLYYLFNSLFPTNVFKR